MSITDNVTPLQPPEVDTSEQQMRMAVRLQLARFGVTQQQLARAVGLSQQAINDRMRGRTRFSMIDLDRFAAAFGMTPGELLRSGETLRARRDSNPQPSDPSVQVVDLGVYRARRDGLAS